MPSFHCRQADSGLTLSRSCRWLRAACCVSLLALLASCVSPGGGTVYGPATPYVSAGDVVVLNQAIVETTGGERAYLQHGQSMPRKAVYQRDPFCYFHVYRDQSVLDTELHVSPDRFRISTISTGVELSELPARVQLAFFGEYITQEASAENLMIRMALVSDTQPAVRWLKCGIFAVRNERGYLSSSEIQEVFGNLLSFEAGNP